MFASVRTLIRRAIMYNWWFNSSLGFNYFIRWVSTGRGSENMEKSEVDPSL